MYTDTNKLTRAGAEQVIKSGGSVLIKNHAGQPQSITSLDALPDEAWFTNQHRVTRGDAEAAIRANGAFTYKGETYHTVEDLPAASEFDKDHKANMEEARKAIKTRRDALDKEIAAVDKNLDDMTVADLHEQAKTLGLTGYSTMHKDELVKAIAKEQKKQAGQ